MMTAMNIFRWKKKKKQQPGEQPFEDRDIPRYPPFMRGLPLASAERLLADQNDILGDIKGTLRATDTLYKEFYLPVIHDYACFVHLLPASETHHHRGAGGLLRHGLETALWAIQAAETVMFVIDEPPETRKKLIPCWEFGVFFAALGHDVGKPIADMVVTDKNGVHEWNPFVCDLIKWGENNGLDRYFIRWRAGRHKRHEALSGLMVGQILDEKSKRFLSQGGPELLEKVIGAISGTFSEKNIIYDLVVQADRTSVEKDLRERRLEGDFGQQLGTPVEKSLFDAMRRMVKAGKWQLNKPGARLWLLQNDLFIVWPQGAKEITDLLAKDNLPGIPRDPDTIADLLIERELAIPDTSIEGRNQRYWKIVPDAVAEKMGGIALTALRVKHPEMLVDPIPPSAAGKIVLAVDFEEFNATKGNLKNQEEHKPSHFQVSTSPAKSEPPVSHAAGSEDEKEKGDAKKKKTTPSDLCPLGPEQTPGPGIYPLPEEFPTVYAPPSERGDEALPKKSHPQEESTSLNKSQTFLEEQGLVGDVLIALAEDLSEGRKKWWTDVVVQADGLVAIQYPYALDGYGTEPKNVLSAVADLDWLDIDPDAPLKKVREAEGFLDKKGKSSQKRAVILNAKVSDHFLKISSPPSNLSPQQRDTCSGSESKKETTSCEPKNSIDPDKYSLVQKIVRMVELEKGNIPGLMVNDKEICFPQTKGVWAICQFLGESQAMVRDALSSCPFVIMDEEDGEKIVKIRKEADRAEL